MTEYEEFLKWIETNDIELYEYQKQVIKKLFEGNQIIIQRRSGMSYSYGAALLVKGLYSSVAKID